jgi:hypothetical protein
MHKAFCERFKPDSVVQFDAAAPYRPVNLSEHGLQAVLRRGNRPRDRNPAQVRADDTRGPGRSPPRSQHRRMTPKQAGPICCIVETDGFPSIRRAPDILRCIGHVMNEALALKLLRNIMNWDEETAASEYRWVRLMSRFKYDGYRDYLAGARFVESFAGWPFSSIRRTGPRPTNSSRPDSSIFPRSRFTGSSISSTLTDMLLVWAPRCDAPITAYRRLS